MTKKKSSHKYLLFLYSRVEEFLSSENSAEKEIPDNIVSFCIAVEKILKIKLHNKNPLLVFDTKYIQDSNSLSIIALKKEKDIETARIKEILGRFKIIFKNIFTEDEFQAISDIYELRNYFVHGYKSEDQIIFDSEDVLKKMGTIWEKVSPIATALFGKENIKNSKPKKKYTEAELEKVLEEEVEKMIKRSDNRFVVSMYDDVIQTNSFFHSGEQCPRCGTYGFSLGGNPNDPWALSVYDSVTGAHGMAGFEGGVNLYKCKKCNLELTEKQYEIAKRIRAF
ncbi:MAG: hypothetical protein V4467_01190 [Patescibacteria group bacterium]